MRGWGNNIGVLLGILTLTFFTVVIHRTNTRSLPKETDEIEQSQTIENQKKTESKEKEEVDLTEAVGLTKSKETEYMESETIVEVPKLPSTGKRLSDFVPDGWKLLDSVELDFNQDGIMDQVGVLEELYPYKTAYKSCSPRILFAIIGKGKEQYQLNFQDCNLIRAREECGMIGEPYTYIPLTAEDISFTTHAYGGAKDLKWTEDFTYTYKESIWYLSYSEETFRYGDLIIRNSIDDWEKGIGIRKERSKDLEETEQYGGEDEPEYDFVYEIPLDEPPTINQASVHWQFAPARNTDWRVETVKIADDINLEENRVRFPSKYDIYDYCDEEGLLYTFIHEELGNAYLAKYCWQDKTLSVIAEEKSGIENVDFYKGKIYYISNILETIQFKEVWEGQEQIVETKKKIGVQLYRINPDGTNRELVFEYLLPQAEQKIWEECPPDLQMLSEISGNEIVVEVSLENQPHSFYRMDLDGGNVQHIGDAR